MGLIETFHIDIKLIIAQLINFFIVLVVLWFFALKPLMKVMKERADKIKGGLKKSQEAEERMKRTLNEKEQILREARKESEKIIAKAKELSEKEREKIISQTQDEAKKILMENKRLLSLEKNKIIKEAESDIADLVILATKKVLNKKMNAEINNGLVEKTVEELKDKKTDAEN